MYINRYDTFYFLMIDCLVVVSCFTFTQTIVGISLWRNFKVCVYVYGGGDGLKVGTPTPTRMPVIGEGYKARLLCLLSGDTYCDTGPRILPYLVTSMTSKWYYTLF